MKLVRAAISVCSLPPCGGGLGRGVVLLDETRQPTPTPTPDPSPQGGGEHTECAALFRRAVSGGNPIGGPAHAVPPVAPSRLQQATRAPLDPAGGDPAPTHAAPSHRGQRRARSRPATSRAAYAAWPHRRFPAPFTY